jgi:hypothetical protein
VSINLVRAAPVTSRLVGISRRVSDSGYLGRAGRPADSARLASRGRSAVPRRISSSSVRIL